PAADRRAMREILPHRLPARRRRCAWSIPPIRCSTPAPTENGCSTPPAASETAPSVTTPRPFESSHRSIDQHVHLAGVRVVGDHQVDATVAVEISGADAAGELAGRDHHRHIEDAAALVDEDGDAPGERGHGEIELVVAIE